jgi:D-glycero-alpha-D-manno-heptose-7-phosphate kinase
LIEALDFWAPKTGLEIATKNDAPKGSGLGASSALLVAILGGLRALGGEPPRWPYPAEEIDDDRFVDWCSRIEAKLLQVPTGKQDYYAALCGGPLAIRFGLVGPDVGKLAPPPGFLDAFERSTLLYFTGEPHFSGAPNWNMLKAYVEGTGDTRARLARISGIAASMIPALESGDLGAVARLLGEEWEQRRGLAEGVSTPQLERIIAGAREAGAWSAKACGAGGGGCLIVMGPPERRDAITAAAAREGARPIAMKLATEGLRVRREHLP